VLVESDMVPRFNVQLLGNDLGQVHLVTGDDLRSLDELHGIQRGTTGNKGYLCAWYYGYYGQPIVACPEAANMSDEFREIELEKGLLERVREIAEKEGKTPEKIISEWVEEKLNSLN